MKKYILTAIIAITSVISAEYLMKSNTGVTSNDFASGNSSPNIVTSGLLVHLDASNSSSYSGSGTTWSDLSGNGNHATLGNGVTYSNEHSGSMSFDGVDDYISMPSSSFPTGNFPFSVDTVVNWENGYHDVLFYYGYDRGQPETPVFSINNSNHLVFEFGSGHGYLEGTTSLTQNQNYLLTVTYSGSEINLYIDGQLEATRAYSGANLRTDNAVNGDNAAIGQTFSNFGNVDTPHGYGRFKGEIPEFRFYNKALTQEEVTQNYDALKTKYGL